MYIYIYIYIYIYTRNLAAARSAPPTISLVRRAHLVPRALWGTLKHRIDQPRLVGSIVYDFY